MMIVDDYPDSLRYLGAMRKLFGHSGLPTRRQLLVAGAGLTASTLMPAVAQERQRIIIDVMDLHVPLKHPVERVVFASHYTHEDFTAIAGREGWAKVVGFTREPWEDWRAATYRKYAKVIPNLADIPDVGTLGIEFDADKVITLKPDVVLLDQFPHSLIGKQVSAIRGAGIPILLFTFREESLFGQLASIVAIGRAMGAKDRLNELYRLHETLNNDLLGRFPGDDAFMKSAYLELAQSGPDTIGFTDSGRLWGGKAVHVGMLNIADGKVPDYGGPLPADELLAADPDILFFAGLSWPDYSKGLRVGYGVDLATTRAGLAAYAGRPGYEQLMAVKAGAVHAIPHDLAWSLREVYAMQYMAKQLNTERFADIDPVKGLAEFHARFLPVPFSGTWFASLS